MGKLIAFNNVTVDGYFAGPNGDIGWAHEGRNDAEFNAFVAENAKAARPGDMLVLGRITYELMASYWPTPLALQNDPVLAERMNELPKLVFSRTLNHTSWNGTTLVHGDVAAEVQRRKHDGRNMTILGSGSIVSQLTQTRLIDEYQIVVNPVVLGRGRTMFDGVADRIDLKLTRSRTFGNGNVLLCYEPA